MNYSNLRQAILPMLKNIQWCHSVKIQLQTLFVAKLRVVLWLAHNFPRRLAARLKPANWLAAAYNGSFTKLSLYSVPVSYWMLPILISFRMGKHWNVILQNIRSQVAIQNIFVAIL